MNKILIIALLLVSANFIFAQKTDTLFEKRISSFTWMPDGSAIILNVLKIDKSEKTAPIIKKFKFTLQSAAIELLPIDGGGLVVSPDGKSVAYIKQVNGKDQIYLYGFTQKEEKLLVSDTLKKYAVSWSPDGKYLVYNIQTGKGANAKVEICTYKFQTNTITQITKNSPFKRYTPVWSWKGDKLAYTSEKGDKRDQIYLTDKNGSFHTNLTNDSTTHNYSPYWLNKKKIIYIQSPGVIMTMKIDGSHKKRIEGISTTQFKYNSKINSIIYFDADGNLIKFDLKRKIKNDLIKHNELNILFNDSYFDK